MTEEELRLFSEFLEQREYARGVVRAMNPIFKQKSGMSAANKMMKNNDAVRTGGYIQNRKQGLTGEVKEISGSDLPKGGLFHPSGENIVNATPYVRNQGTRIQSGSKDLLGIVPSNNFKEFDSVSQLKTGRAHSRASYPQQLDDMTLPGRRPGHPLVGRGAIATISNVPIRDSSQTPLAQAEYNLSNLHTAINARGNGDSLGNYHIQVSGMKAQSVHNRLGYMNPIKRVFGGKKKLESMSLNQLFRS